MPESLEDRFNSYWSIRAPSLGRATECLVNENPLFRSLLENMLVGTNYHNALDLGTGAGLMAIELARLGFETTAMDYNDDMLNEAFALSKKLGLDIEFIKGNIENPLIRNNSFDIIVAKDSVWNLEKPEDAYRRWKDILRPGGLLIIIDNNYYLYQTNPDYQKRYESVVKEPSNEIKWMRYHPDQKMMDICSNLAKELPLTKELRPGWDVSILMRQGFDKIKIHSLDHYAFTVTDEKGTRGTPMSFILTASLPNTQDTHVDYNLPQSMLDMHDLRKRIDNYQSLIGNSLKCLSNEGCCKILMALCETDMNVGQCAQLLNISHALASHDLKLLKTSGFVDSIKDGKESIYYLKDKDMVNRFLLEVILAKDDRYHRNY